MTTSAAAGVMNPLIGKLTTLMGEEYKKLKGVRKEVAFLKDELSAMNAALEKLEFMEKLEPDTKDWRDHVREMSYDMENCIDDFMKDIGGADSKASAGFMKRTTRRLKTLRVRHRIAGQIEELKALALEANERRKRYKIDECNTCSDFVPIDPRISAIYKEAAGLVGTDGPKKEVASLLADSETKLKVVSIVGFGGLGKTTLANQVYDGLEGKFDCKAFISVSQKPDMARLLNSLRSKLGINESFGICEVEDIICQLREHLTNKRYFIIVDDLWDQGAWEIIRCAFPENGNGSRVIVTTRVEAVAISACSYHCEQIYRMKPLSSEDSRRLFMNRIFGSENMCPSDLEEVSNEILKKCGGLPLAIITIASLLACRQERSRNIWENIRNSLGAQFAINPTLKDMRSILNLSYMNLPLHLRTCFLYLGMYPEDFEIDRDDLVRQWIAEGFVSNLHGTNLEDVGISYFNELVNRSLIQPVMTSYGRVYCKVHDMMLDLILSKCAEDNFSSVAYTSEDMTRLLDCRYKIRRLSLISHVDTATLTPSETVTWTVSDSTSQIRSLLWFGYCKSTPRLCLLKYIRVLCFEHRVMIHNSSLDLTAIGQLFQLRYLKVSPNQRVELPTEIRGLVHLDTLDIPNASIPSDIVHLPRLSHLTMGSHLIMGWYEMIGLPERIGIMESLRTLDGFEPEKSSLEAIKGLGKLTNLRTLSLGTPDPCNLEKAQLDALASSLCKLRNLKSLSITGRQDDKDDVIGSLSDPPALIEEMYLGINFLRVPKWIGDLHCLLSLYLSVRETKTDGISILGGLPSLVDLKLTVDTCPKEEAVNVSKGLFTVLERLTMSISGGDVTAYLGFEAGAMPKLRELGLRFNALLWSGATPAGMEHLLGLQQISLTLYGIKKESHEQVKLEVGSAFRNALQLHPRRPSLDIKCWT